MTRDDIIDMAEIAGISGIMEAGLIEYFESFANLVAVATLEECSIVCEELALAQTSPQYSRACMDCFAAIRARGQK